MNLVPDYVHYFIRVDSNYWYGASETSYLNTYHIQQSECSDGDLNYLLK